MDLLDKIKETTEKVIQDTPYKLVDITRKKHKSGFIFTIFLDSMQGITIDTCKKFSDRIAEELDTMDIIENYILEVSSPGTERPLTEEWQYMKNKGRLLKIQFYETPEIIREITGRLADIRDRKLVLELKNKKKSPPEFREISYDRLKNVKIELEW